MDILHQQEYVIFVLKGLHVAHYVRENSLLEDLPLLDHALDDLFFLYVLFLQAFYSVQICPKLNVPN